MYQDVLYSLNLCIRICYIASAYLSGFVLYSFNLVISIFIQLQPIYQDLLYSVNIFYHDFYIASTYFSRFCIQLQPNYQGCAIQPQLVYLNCLYSLRLFIKDLLYRLNLCITDLLNSFNLFILLFSALFLAAMVKQTLERERELRFAARFKKADGDKWIICCEKLDLRSGRIQF